MLKILTSALTMSPEERGDAQGPTEGSDVSVVVCFVVFAHVWLIPLPWSSAHGRDRDITKLVSLSHSPSSLRFQPQSRMMSKAGTMDGREEFD